MKREIGWFVTSLLATTIYGQVADWNLAGNNGVTSSSKLGSTVAAPVSLYTNDVLRTRLHEGNSITINGFSGVNQAGYLGVGRNSTFFNSPGVVSAGSCNARFTEIPYRNHPAFGLYPSLSARRSTRRAGGGTRCWGTLQ